MHINIKKDKNNVCGRLLLQVHMSALCYVEITTFKNISHPTVGSGSLPDKVIPSWNPILAPTQGKIYLVFVTFIIIRISSHKYHFIIRAFLYICQIILWTNKSNQPKSIYLHSIFIRTKFLYNRTRTTRTSLIIPDYPITGVIINGGGSLTRTCFSLILLQYFYSGHNQQLHFHLPKITVWWMVSFFSPITNQLCFWNTTLICGA